MTVSNFGLKSWFMSFFGCKLDTCWCTHSLFFLLSQLRRRRSAALTFGPANVGAGKIDADNQVSVITVHCYTPFVSSLSHSFNCDFWWRFKQLRFWVFLVWPVVGGGLRWVPLRNFIICNCEASNLCLYFCGLVVCPWLIAKALAFRISPLI